MERPSSYFSWSATPDENNATKPSESCGVADSIMRGQLEQRRARDAWKRPPLGLPTFTVATGCARPEGYSDKHKARINMYPEAMFDMLKQQGALYAQIELDPEKTLYCALAGSPYTDIRDSETTHFMAFIHEESNPAFFNPSNLEVHHMKAFVDLAFSYIAEDPSRRVAGFNIGPQNEEGIESPQGWANLHLQCFGLPHPTRRTLLSDTHDTQTQEFVARKSSFASAPLAPFAHHVAHESRLFLGGAGHIDQTSGEPHQFTIRFPKGSDHEHIARYLQTLHGYLNAVHPEVMNRSHAATSAPRPSKPIYTVGFGQMGEVEALRVSLLSGVRGSMMGVAESAYRMFPLRAANSAAQSFDDSHINLATAEELAAFQARTSEAAQRACERVTTSAA